MADIQYARIVGDWRRVVGDEIVSYENTEIGDVGIHGTVTLSPVWARGGPQGIVADPGAYYSIHPVVCRVRYGRLYDPTNTVPYEDVAVEIDGQPLVWKAKFELAFRRRAGEAEVPLQVREVTFDNTAMVAGEIALTGILPASAIPAEYQAYFANAALSATVADEAKATAVAAAGTATTAAGTASSAAGVADAKAAAAAASVTLAAQEADRAIGLATASDQAVADTIVAGGPTTTALKATYGWPDGLLNSKARPGAQALGIIQTELNTLSAAGGGTLQLAGGLFDDLSRIDIPAYCSLRGVGWSITQENKGTVLRFAVGQNGIAMNGQASSLMDLSVISKEAGVGTSVGVAINHTRLNLTRVNVGKFGSHGFLIDSSGQSGNRNLTRMDQCRAYSNGGDGLRIAGADSNAGVFTLLDLTANGGAQIYCQGARNFFIGCHIDSASQPNAYAVIDEALSNSYELYVESTTSPTGDVFKIGPNSYHGSLSFLLYAGGKIEGASGNISSWRIEEGNRNRSVTITQTNRQGAATSDGEYRFDVGIAAAGSLRLRNMTTSFDVFSVAANGSFMSFGLPLIPSPNLGQDLGRSANVWRDVFTQSVRLANTATLPTAGVSRRGQVITVQGGTGVADQMYICRKTAAETYEWAKLTV